MIATRPETTEDLMTAPSLAAADPLDMADAMLRQGDDPWELLVSAGITWRDQIDTGRWKIGDAALLIDKRYGEDTLTRYANGIGATPRSVKDYRQTCGFWHKPVRESLLQELPKLTYTHFRQAMRLKDLGAAAAFLQECSDADWSAERADVEISKRLKKPVPPCKLIDAKLLIDAWGKQRVAFALSPDQMLKLLDSYKAGSPVRLVIYDVPTAEAGGAG